MIQAHQTIFKCITKFIFVGDGVICVHYLKRLPDMGQ
jgi:hypothetical protein